MLCDFVCFYLKDYLLIIILSYTDFSVPIAGISTETPYH